MASYYVCARCGKKWPTRLETGQVCPECQTELAWEQLAGHNAVKISSPDLVAKPPSLFIPPSGMDTWVLPALSFACVGVGLVLLLLYFWDSGADSPSILLQRLNTYLLFAGVAGSISFALSGVGYSTFLRPTTPRHRTLQTVYGIALLIAGLVLVLAVANFIFAIDRVPYVPSFDIGPGESVSNPLVMMQMATVAFVGSRSERPFHKLFIRGGIRVRIRGHIVTMSKWNESMDKPADRHRPWMHRAHGEPGQLPTAFQHQQNINLVTYEEPWSTDLDATSVTIDPHSRSVIVGEHVTLARNPVNSVWQTVEGVVVMKERVSSTLLLHTTLPYNTDDEGCGVFNAAGELIGLLWGYDETSESTLVKVISPDLFETYQ